ncbi:hypothetical protein L6164_004099 [Bauhinia variegata]|uniref:Uncharacterized protein n=1 Tax=Bauhinia variegata TaxID=167791 RepID=A0ACB9Q4V0_BAUVA|nr:hypothetical protein L6164_004099 [Bauhinia variegata]
MIRFLFSNLAFGCSVVVLDGSDVERHEMRVKFSVEMNQGRTNRQKVICHELLTGFSDFYRFFQRSLNGMELHGRTLVVREE